MQQMLLGLGAVDSYEIARSVRLDRDDTPYFSKNPSSAGNRQKFTISFWVKKVGMGVNQAIFYAGTSVGTNHNNTDAFLFDGSDQLFFGGEVNQSVTYAVTTNRKFRDPSAWYHIVLAVDTTDNTASNRIKFYVNGVQETSFASATYPSQNQNTFVNSTVSGNIHVLGYTHNSRSMNGYIAEYHLIDGQQLTPTSFGKTNSATGQWNPIEYTGTHGTNGFYLNFSAFNNNAAIGTDYSGNSNNYTVNNISSSHDTVTDTPTKNFCTLNSIADAGATYGNGTLSNAGLRYTGGSNNRTIASTFGISPSDSKGYYFESKIISGNQANRLFVGIGYTSTNWVSTDARGANDDSWVLRNGDGVFIHNSGTDGETTGAGALSVGDIIQIAVKGSNVWVGKNNTWLFSGDPANNSTPKFNDVNETWTPVADVMTSNVINFNFGQDSTFGTGSGYQGNTDGNGHGDFYYTPPSGFFALCSENLPNPTIKQSNKYFDIVLYTGNGATTARAITGFNFAPDFVWLKNRETNYHHQIHDTVRGTSGGVLYTNNTDAEDATYSLASFNNDGFSISKDNDQNGQNNNGDNYVSWCWHIGGSTVSNNDGSVTSQVKANTTAGFSIVSYTGTGSNISVGHGLGIKPDIVIVKSRDDTNNWLVHSTLYDGTFDQLFLNTAAVKTNVTSYNVQTSSVFNRPAAQDLNNEEMIAYCFHSVEGFSQFGSFTGNAQPNGGFVYLGFRPALVIIKKFTPSGQWVMLDDTRNAHNGTNSYLFANENNVEASETSGSNMNEIDILANGFKLRNGNAKTNAGGKVMLYMAWARSPFKYSRAR